MINFGFASALKAVMRLMSKSSIITEENLMREVPLATPGNILLEEFLKPMGISQYRLAKTIGVPQSRIGNVVAGKQAITADTALRLAAFFGTDAQSWLNLQTHYDTEMAKEVLSPILEEIKSKRGAFK
ncbi:MAG: HigA family addiction module antitoxin [Methylococcales bacterium]